MTERWPPDKGKNGDSWNDIMDNDPNTNYKYIKMSIVNPQHSFHHISQLELPKALPSREKGLLKVQNVYKDNIVMKVQIGSEAESTLLSWKSLKVASRELAVKVSPMDNLNTSTGTIFAPELDSTDVNQITEMCKNVVKIERMTRFDPIKQLRVFSNMYKVIFNSRMIPEVLCVGYCRFRVRTYYPLPRSCIACLSYSHLLKNCPAEKNTAICRTCGLNVGLDVEESNTQGKRIIKKHECQSPVCPNCSEGFNSHRPTSNECPARQNEVQVIRIKIDHDLSYPEARRRVASGSFATANVSYANAARNNGEFAELKAMLNKATEELALASAKIESQAKRIESLIEENENLRTEFMNLLSMPKNQRQDKMQTSMSSDSDASSVGNPKKKQKKALEDQFVDEASKQMIKKALKSTAALKLTMNRKMTIAEQNKSIDLKVLNTEERDLVLFKLAEKDHETLTNALNRCNKSKAPYDLRLCESGILFNQRLG